MGPGKGVPGWGNNTGKDLDRSEQNCQGPAINKSGT